MPDQVAKDTLVSFIQGLTSEQVTDLVKHSNQSNFFMYAFIIFAFIMIVGMVAIVSIFIRKDSKKDIRQNEQYKTLIDSQAEQYKGLLDGYTKMIDQNATTNSEFRKTIADIGEVLRELTNTISKSEANSFAEGNKLDILLSRMDTIKEDVSKSNAGLHQAFREHDHNNSNFNVEILKSVEKMKEEIKSNTEWCKKVKS